MLVIILAAGKGTRMKSRLPKVLTPVAGKPMLHYTIQLAKELNADKTVVVVGNGHKEVEDEFQNERLTFRLQKEQLGTADAVLAARDDIEAYTGQVLILNGDMPNISTDTMKKFISESGNGLAFISVKSTNSTGYGRVIRSVGADVLKIVEEKDANPSEKKINEINTGVYLCDAAELLRRLSSVSNNNAQHEYYLTDIITAGAKAWKAPEENEFLGVNDRVQLASLSKIIWKKRALKHMLNGVSIIDPDNVYISDETVIGNDVTVYPGVYLEGACDISSGTEIRHGVRIVDSAIGESCVIKENTLIEQSKIGYKSKIGPMAHIRPGTMLEGENSIGNFVELKKAIVAKGTKASHLTYLGDCTIGKDVNIGCGTITCNYDGFKKHETVIGDRVFVGSDVQFVAPVKIGDGAIIAAGTTVTRDVTADALAIARTPQQNIENKAAQIREAKGK